MTTPPSVVDGCAEPLVDGMAPHESESGVIVWRHRFRRRRARLAPSSAEATEAVEAAKAVEAVGAAEAAEAAEAATSTAAAATEAAAAAAAVALEWRRAKRCYEQSQRTSLLLAMRESPKWR